jgi:hypothetical protein
MIKYERFVKLATTSAGGFVISALAAGRNVVWLLLGVLVILLMMRRVHRRRIGRWATIAAFIAVVVSHWSPLDVCVRCSRPTRIAVMPILYQDHTYAEWRRLKKLGLTANTDFVVYRRWPLFPPAKSAIVIALPAICHGEEFSPESDEE